MGSAAPNVYRILPFDGPRFHDNQRRLKPGETPCAICGKAVKYPFKHSATVVRGGDWARTTEEAGNEEDPGYMGIWGIGPDCHQKHLITDPAEAQA